MDLNIHAQLILVLRGSHVGPFAYSKSGTTHTDDNLRSLFNDTVVRPCCFSATSTEETRVYRVARYRFRQSYLPLDLLDTFFEMPSTQ